MTDALASLWKSVHPYSNRGRTGVWWAKDMTGIAEFHKVNIIVV